MTAQTGWLPEPARDKTPIVTGGAILVMRLSPEEVTALLDHGPTLHEAAHAVFAAIPDPEHRRSER